ncbi:MAG: LA2681 family HEPN domain-containing protein [Thiolinea sp.]
MSALATCSLDAIEESQKTVHFSTRALLYDMLDYREYRLWIEKAKMAFLGAHAIFDKIAYLINKHWSLGLPARKIDFKSYWFNNGCSSKGLANPFISSDNWALRDYIG